MLTIVEYVKLNNLDTTKYTGRDEEREEMKEKEYYYYFGENYMCYVNACIIDARSTNSKQ